MSSNKEGFKKTEVGLTSDSPYAVGCFLLLSAITLEVIPGALVLNDVEQELAAENAAKPERKHAYKANRNLSIAKLKDNVVRLLLDQIDVASFYGDLIEQVKRNKVPIRPGRHFPRKRRHKSKYSINKKRAL